MCISVAELNVSTILREMSVLYKLDYRGVSVSQNCKDLVNMVNISGEDNDYTWPYLPRSLRSVYLRRTYGNTGMSGEQEAHTACDGPILGLYTSGRRGTDMRAKNVLSKRAPNVLPIPDEAVDCRGRGIAVASGG